ncbi:MFS transporter [Rhizocola hellebori]|uniref:MFS transporter n=1 Tax=Rhizocola hellebori TaxID=1392758 RepID=A0A8J3QCB6_9ACTN|nr:MFS transporter [Rhizocola hellebori]GIH08144.1 MFS transporter [Rhizocola hellebori]
MTTRRLARSLYALRITDEFIPWFPLYALYMIDSGVSAGELASLFVIWSVTAFTVEIPSGAWADAFSRRKLVALGAAIRGVGFLIWTIWPSYWGFALGFVLWGIRSAMKSGAVEALVYDELAAIGQTDAYLRIVGRGQTLAIAAMMLATALGAPIFSFGGYGLAGWLSVAVSLAGVAAALSFPETPRVKATATGGVTEYLHQLRAGLHEARFHPIVRHVLILAIAMAGLTAFDEFLPLLLKELGAATALVPLLLLIPAVAMAAAATVTSRLATISPATAGRLLLAAAALLAIGPLTGHPVLAMLLVAGSFGATQIVRLVSESRLQQAIATTARATVLSVAGLGAELLAVTVYFGYGLGSTHLPATTLIALFALPLTCVALLARRWLPTPPPHQPPGLPPHRPGSWWLRAVNSRAATKARRLRRRPAGGVLATTPHLLVGPPCRRLSLRLRRFRHLPLSGTAWISRR